VPGAALVDSLPTSQARDPRRASPAPHQAGHRPNNRPPLPPPQTAATALMTGKGTPEMPGNYDDETYEKICKEDLEFFGPPGPGERYISYWLDPDERPRGLNVRFLVKVVSGNHAKARDAMQAEAILALLRWSREYRQQHGQAQDQEAPGGPPVPDQAARE
jgi:hypothetical protein